MSAATKFRMSDGDWVCGDEQCANVNFARRTACNRCNRERSSDRESARKKLLCSEIGKAAAEKSKGLFSADDWQCSKCGNVNWARRQQCNICNAPKCADVEERTGYGGGYNDRGVVEYVRRRDSDSDEFDEFGRRKKKREKRGHGEDNTSDDDDKDGERNVHKHSKRKHDEDDDVSEKDKTRPADKEEDEVEDEEDEEEDEDEEDLSKYDLTEWGEA